jgi:L-fuculose-phosphate aldolase
MTRGRRPGPRALAALKADVALACRVLAAEGQGDLVWGHVSARDPGGRGLWMKAAGLGLEEATPANLLLLDPDGAVLAGRHPRHVEYPIHAEILRARPDVQAVVHTHPLHATAFSALRVPLRPVSHEACLFVPPDVPRFARTTDLIVTAELGRAVADALGRGWAVLLENHGIVTAGATVGDACFRALALERAARAQLLLGGREQAWTPDAEAMAKRERIYQPRALGAVWAYLARRARRT